MSEFTLHPTLEKDSLYICDFEFTVLRLINNASVPWCILVPKKNNVTHLTDLSADEQDALMHDVRKVTYALQNIFAPDRVNVGMLGNMVPQMHWHVIARMEGDPAWPGPVWGNVPNIPYKEDAAQLLISNIKNALDKI